MYVQSVPFATDVLTYAIAQRIQDSAKKPVPAAAPKRLQWGRSRATPQLHNDDMQQGMEEGTAALPSSKTGKAAAFFEGTPEVVVVSLSYQIPDVLN
jgi:hypothetical protein